MATKSDSGLNVKSAQEIGQTIEHWEGSKQGNGTEGASRHRHSQPVLVVDTLPLNTR